MTYEEILSQPIDKTSFCVLDVETTGLSAQYNNIIELGIVRVKNLKIVEKYHSLLNPGREIRADSDQRKGEGDSLRETTA